MVSQKKNRPFFPIFFSLVFLLFIGILIYVWFGTKQAAPVILDERGHERTSTHSPQP